MELIINIATLVAVVVFSIASQRRDKKIMASVDEVKASFAKFVADVKAKLDALQAKLDAGSAVEASDLDQLKTVIDDADTALNPPPA